MRRLAMALLLVACHRPREVVQVSADSHLLGAFHGRVYWIDDGFISWIDDKLRKPEAWHVTGTDWATRANFAADAGGSYFSHHNRISHLAFDPTPGTWGEEPSLDSWVQAARSHPSGAAVDEHCVYAIDSDVSCHDDGVIAAVPKQKGDQCANLSAPANGIQPLEFQMDGDYFYWADGYCSEFGSKGSQGLKAMPRAGGETKLITGVEDAGAQGLRIGTRGLYFRTRAGLRFVDKKAFGKAVTLVAGDVTSLAVNGDGVFFAKPDGVYRLDKKVRQIAAAQNPHELVADDLYLYWRVGRTIWRAPY